MNVNGYRIESLRQANSVRVVNKQGTMELRPIADVIAEAEAMYAFLSKDTVQPS